MRAHVRSGFKKILVPTALFLLLLLALSVFVQLQLPAPTGPYAVGRTILRWTDTSRAEVMTEAPNDVRQVTALVWYPAVPATGQHAGYFPDMDSLADELADSGEVAAWQVYGLRWIRTDSPLDAQPVIDQAPFPVVLLAPGNGTNVEFYSSLAGELASNGFVVVGINHPYDVAAVQLSDGSVAPYDKEQWSLDVAAHQAYIAERHPVKIADLLFVLDQLSLMNSDTASPFAGILDLDAAAAAGHSLGGLVASDACKLEARFKACLNFDGIQKGGPFSMDESALPPKQPFLFLTKEAQLHPKLVQAFESTAESYWVVVHGASHDSFTDGPLLQPSLLPIPDQNDRYMDLIESYTLAFLAKTLRGEPDSLLSETISGEQISVRVFPSR